MNLAEPIQYKYKGCKIQIWQDGLYYKARATKGSLKCGVMSHTNEGIEEIKRFIQQHVRNGALK